MIVTKKHSILRTETAGMNVTECIKIAFHWG